MTWSYTIPGQPPSVNSSYKIVSRSRTSADGSRKHYKTLGKRDEVVLYQAQARLVVAAAKPSGWRPGGYVRTYFRFYLARDMDVDNLLKTQHDIIEKATKVNDRWFLPTVILKEIVPAREARVEVVVEDPASRSVDPPIWTSTPTP